MSREIVLARLEEVSDKLSPFNSWPDMEVIGHKIYSPTQLQDIYRAGQIMGRAQSVGVLRQIKLEHLPASIPTRAGGYSPRWLSVWFVLNHAAGQEDMATRRNLLAVFELNNSGYGKVPLVVEVELGCKHDYEIKQLGPCYRSGTCKKCGHKFTVDSGD